MKQSLEMLATTILGHCLKCSKVRQPRPKPKRFTGSRSSSEAKIYKLPPCLALTTDSQLCCCCSSRVAVVDVVVVVVGAVVAAVVLGVVFLVAFNVVAAVDAVVIVDDVVDGGVVGADCKFCV